VGRLSEEEVDHLKMRENWEVDADGFHILGSVVECFHGKSTAMIR